MNCFVVAHADKFATIYSNNVLCFSKHKDYSIFHWKARDVASLKKPIERFVFLDRTGEVLEAIEASALERRGSNYASAPRVVLEITEDLAVEIAAAMLTVRSFGQVAGVAVSEAKKGNPVEEVIAAQLLGAMTVDNTAMSVVPIDQVMPAADAPTPADGTDLPGQEVRTGGKVGRKR